MSEEGASAENGEHGNEGFSYSYRPSVVGGEWVFRLTPTGIGWEQGFRSGIVTYRSIRRVRLSYRPSTLQTRRYMTEIWGDGPKLSISSTTFRGLVDQQPQDAAYSRFIAEFHRRLMQAAIHPVLSAGSPALLYWPGAAIVAASMVAVVWLILRALGEGSLSGAVIVAAFGLLFLWHGGTFFVRNRPRGYRLDALPPDLVPDISPSVSSAARD